MKKFLAFGLCMALLFALAIPAMAYTEITAPKATITLDGNRDDSYAGPFEIKGFWESEDVATGQVWISWDDNYINYYFEIKDTTPFHDHSNDYQRDCVELFFDWYNAKDFDTSDVSKPYWQYRICSAPAEDGAQFHNGINQAAGEDGTGWSLEEHVNSMAANTVVKPLVGNDLKGGYIVETRVEYKKFGVNISEGSVIGIDFFIGDNTEDAGRTGGSFLNPDYNTNEQWQDPQSVGGLLTLGAAPAPAVVEEAPAAEVAPAVTPATTAPTPAPRTADPIAIFAIGSIISAAGVVIARRKK